jgi:RNA polymerase sigma-70 factor, ECF subfamily
MRRFGRADDPRAEDDGMSALVQRSGAWLAGTPLATRRHVTFPAGGRGAGNAITVEFDTAITGFSAKLRAFIRRRVRDDATADDLTQETLLKVYRSRSALRDEQRLEAWIYRIARTTVADHFRRTRPTDTLPEAIAGDPPDEIARLREAVLRSMRVFLEELPAAYREPVRLAELEGLPLAKIALRLDLSLTAVKSRVRRGRAMLKKKLQECCRFEFDRMGKVIGYERRRATPCAC